VRGLSEGKEWLWDNGTLMTAQLEQLQREVTRTSVKTKSQSRKLEMKVYEDFMRRLIKGTRVL
jgi:Txe/YoeB family toxin of Txe-Axe toxin-antitoxin module